MNRRDFFRTLAAAAAAGRIPSDSTRLKRFRITVQEALELATLLGPWPKDAWDMIDKMYHYKVGLTDLLYGKNLAS